MRFDEILGGAADTKNNQLIVRAVGEGGQETELRFGSGAIANLITVVLSEAGKLPSNPYTQLMTLTGAKLFQVQADGRVGLELQLDKGLRLPVLFPRTGIAALRNALSAVEAQGKRR